MGIRLPHVLGLMLLVLLAGVVSVEFLETRWGGAAVPGLVLVDAPSLSAADLDALAQAWAPRGTVRRESLFSPRETPLGPFDAGFVRGAVRRGDVCALFSLDPSLRREDAAGSGPWPVFLDTFPAVGGATSAATMLAAAAGFVRAQTTTRAFLAGLVLDPADATGPDLTALLDALAVQPAYRRSSLVLLGAVRHGERQVLRLDVGPWGRRARPGLADLLALSW